MKEYVIVTSDQHVNSPVGLLAPVTYLDSGNRVEQNSFQHYIWQSWLDFCQHVNNLRGYKTVIMNGDLGDTDPGQHITQNKSVIAKMLLSSFEPLLDVANIRFVVRGTEYHAGPVAEVEENFAREIGAEPDPDTGTASWWHLRMCIQNINLDIAHHTTIGGLPWTETGPLIRLIYQTILENQRAGCPIPDIIARGHVHTRKDTYGEHPQVRAFTTPSWQGKTAHGHKRATGKRTVFGGTIITIDRGEYEIEHIDYIAKKDTIWTPQPSN